MTDTSFLTDALDDIKGSLSDEMLAGLAEYDGSTTILVPNLTENFVLRDIFEGPQVIQFGTDALKSYPTRLRWDLRVASTAIRHTDATTMTGRRDWNMVLVGSRHCQVYVGGRWVPDFTFFSLLIKAAGGKDDHRSVEDIFKSLQERGLNLNGEMPMYLQHLGADEERFASEIAPLFESLGAYDNTNQVRNQPQGQGKSKTVRSLRLEGNAVKVVSFEIGTSDRSRSQNNSGFIGFLDATYSTVRSIVEADRTIEATKKVLNDPNADEQDRSIAFETHSQMNTYWGSGTTRTRRPFHNWGGTTRVQNADGSVRFYSTPVPCGRLIIADERGNEHPINVWMNSQGSAQTPSMSAPSAPVLFEPEIPLSDLTGDVEPF